MAHVLGAGFTISFRTQVSTAVPVLFVVLWAGTVMTLQMLPVVWRPSKFGAPWSPLTPAMGMFFTLHLMGAKYLDHLHTSMLHVPRPSELWGVRVPHDVCPVSWLRFEHTTRAYLQAPPIFLSTPGCLMVIHQVGWLGYENSQIQHVLHGIKRSGLRHDMYCPVIESS